MATRQELCTAIDIIRRTCRTNNHNLSLGRVLTAINPHFSEEQKHISGAISDLIYRESTQMIAFLDKIDDGFLNRGLNGIPVPANRKKVDYDTDTSNTLSANANKMIGHISDIKTAKSLGAKFVLRRFECGLDEPDPRTLFSEEVNHANILHDIIDAISYELQGKNSDNGQVHLYDNERLVKLISDRIFTAKVYLSHLPRSLDQARMRDIVNYVEKNFQRIPHSELGRYIDNNLEKQIIVRRWWSL